MNTVDHQLARLFKAATRVPRGTAGALSVALENRALMFWRNGVAADHRLFVALPLLRRALALACVVALVTLVLHYRDLTWPVAEEAVIINSPISFSYPP